MRGDPREEFPELAEDAWHVLEARVRAFEDAWARPGRPDVAEYLLDPDPTGGQLLIELAHADLEFRIRSGDPARAADYVAAFPDLADRADELSSAERRLRERYRSRFLSPGTAGLPAPGSGVRPSAEDGAAPADIAEKGNQGLASLERWLACFPPGARRSVEWCAELARSVHETHLCGKSCDGLPLGTILVDVRSEPTGLRVSCRRPGAGADQVRSDVAGLVRVLNALLSVDPETDASVPRKELEAVRRRASGVTPGGSYPTAAALAEDLERLLLPAPRRTGPDVAKEWAVSFRRVLSGLRGRRRGG